MLFPLRILFVTALAGSVSACTSAKLAGTVQGEPVCVDFELGGGNKMKGSLRLPVRIAILEDADDDPLWERHVYGKRSADDHNTIFAVADEDAEYIVRWSQCPNAFAPKPVETTTKTTDRAGSYACGEAKTYHESKLTVRQGDKSSRVIQWVAAPESECWVADTMTTAGSPSASASSAPSSAPSSTPSAAASASSASASSATSASASAPPPDPPPDPPSTKPPAAPPAARSAAPTVAPRASTSPGTPKP